VNNTLPMKQRLLVAGTFDRLHAGHEALLSSAFLQGEHVTVALTSNTYVTSYKFIQALSFDERKKELETWVNSHGYKGKCTIIAIDDPYEPAASGSFDGIVVSSQTKPRAEEINGKRVERSLPPLEIVEVPMVLAQDGLPVSATRVKEGIIDSTGKLMMPETLRKQLTSPFGRVLHTDEDIIQSLASHKGVSVISVGDVTTTKIMKFGVTPSLAIVDLQVQRKPFTTLEAYGFSNQTRILRVQSGPGFVALTALEAIQDWVVDCEAGRVHPYVIIVHGEEDLLVLPVMLKSPVGSVVYYGQPPSTGKDEGMVEVVVTKELKDSMQKLIEQFILK
jgi:pantetheine-phosphate adenylyltransferase